MADLPDQLDLGRHRDVSWRGEIVGRRILLAVLTVLAVVALSNAFGQRPETSVAASESAVLEVSAPDDLRGGLFFQGRFTVRAIAAIGDPVLVFAPGWLENMHINTIEPAPTEEASRDGRLALSFSPLAAGDRLVLHMQFQVNPTNVGRRSADVELYDGETLLVAVERMVTVYP